MDQALDSREGPLVNILLTGTALTQVQTAKALYGQATNANLLALERLKSRVQARLLNHFYFLDHGDPLSLVPRRYQMACLDLLHKGPALYTEGEYVLSQRLLRRCPSACSSWKPCIGRPKRSISSPSCTGFG